MFYKEIITNNDESFDVTPFNYIKKQPMKKKILNFALIAAMVSTIAAGCSSSKSASGSDSTKMDSAKMKTPPAAADTMKKDTMKKDTTHH
ncbi:MAG: hypothetical protein M3O71_15040 [Bacteroidota bacterium]|nr:hypothetical protein [Bacteroidota bacterium]